MPINPALDNAWRYSLSDSVGKPWFAQTNLYQYVGANPVNWIDPTGLLRVWGIRIWGEPSKEEQDAFYKTMEKEVGELGAGAEAYGKYQEKIDKCVWLDMPKTIIEKLEDKINKLQNK